MYAAAILVGIVAHHHVCPYALVWLLLVPYLEFTVSYQRREPCACTDTAYADTGHTRSMVAVHMCGHRRHRPQTNSCFLLCVIVYFLRLSISLQFTHLPNHSLLSHSLTQICSQPATNCLQMSNLPAEHICLLAAQCGASFLNGSSRRKLLAF